MKPTVCLKITLTAWLINHITCIRVLNVILGSNGRSNYRNSTSAYRLKF